MLVLYDPLQLAKEVAGLSDFAIGLVNFVLNLPDGLVKFFEEGIVKSILTIKTCLGPVEMMFGLVNASFSFPEWQAVKLTFFALCSGKINSNRHPLPFGNFGFLKSNHPFPLGNSIGHLWGRYMDIFWNDTPLKITARINVT